MDSFKKLPKIQHFKEGGTVQRQIANFEKRERKSVEHDDVKEDKKIVKKAFSMHDTQQHEKKTDLTKLCSGGRAKKEVGTVKKFKCGGGVYGAKKTDKDLKSIAAAKNCKPKMAEGGSIIDSIKEAGTTLKNNIMGTPEQNRIAQEQMNKQAAQGSKLAKFFGGKADAQSAPVAKKCGGKVKKMNTGGTAS